MKYFITYILITVTSLATLGQEQKGDELMASNLYHDAIKAYQKALKKSENGLLHQKLGRAYLYSKDYINADKHYTVAMKSTDNNAATLFQFGKELLVLNYKKEAKKYFDQYLKSYPNDYLATQYISLYDSSLSIPNTPKYLVSELAGSLNSAKAEFGAQPFQNGLLYITEGSSDLLYDEKTKNTNTNYFSIYYSKKDGESYGLGELFDPKINSDWHNGSVAITPDGKELYFTQSYRNLTTEVIQLFYCELENGVLSKPKPFEYNNKEYSILHPAFNSDGSVLFFSSDKKNGKGGLDIYYSTKDRKYGWLAPKPINGRINTAGNEAFPHYKNGILYFSSDGHFGEGGLDIFAAKEDDYYNKIENLGSPINSSKDDFSIYFATNNTGFFSSDRLSGKGKDDIYRFTTLEQPVKIDATTSLTGVFELRKLGMANQEIILLNEFGEEIERVRTDEKGNFIFKKLISDANYSIQLAEDLEGADLYLTNSKGEKIVLVEKTGKKFLFKSLEPSYTETLLPIEIEDATFLIIPVKGFVFKTIKGDLNQRLEIKVYDDNNNLIGRTYTNNDGTFIFKTLTPQNNYYFELETEEELQLIIQKNSKELLEASKQENGTFLYKRLKSGEDGLLLVNENNELIRILQNERFAIDNILYATNSAELNIEAITHLNKLYIMYKRNIHLTFTIESHTDSKGSDKYNLKLSEKRAKKVVDYLVEKGVPKKQLIAIGYGETKLLNNCDNTATCSEEEHAINRRTEIKFKGIKTDF